MDLYKAMCDTAEQCGLKILSDDYCCKLLAWVLVYGGEKEGIVFGTKIRMDIEIAQKRLNLFGSEIPDWTLQPILKRYVKECEEAEKKGTVPDWVKSEIESKYGKL